MITIPTSNYFQLHQLADGVYAAVGKTDSPAFSNAGIIDTGEHTLIFDTFNTFHAAEDLRRAAEIITNRSADFVIISHAHSDHWMGNQVFADHASILTTRQAQDAMVEWFESFKELKRNPEEYQEYIAEIEARLAATDDEYLQAHLSWSLKIECHEFENLRATRPQLAEQAFDGRLAFHGPKRTVHLYTPGAGHTSSDVILQLPQDGCAFIGDLGFFKTHPFLGSSIPEKWIATLETLTESDYETFVPGHGPVGDKDDLLALKEYIQTLKELASDVVKRGGSEEDAVAQAVPEFSSQWAGLGRFERSMRFLYQRLAELDQKGPQSE